MRITGGLLRGRRISVPKRGVRPTQDRVREAVFSSLGEYVRELRVLDLFAGSGALGLEAWSRGADYVCWVEKDPRVFHLLQDNVRGLCVDGGMIKCVMKDAWSFLRSPPAGGAYDLILADPPYDRRGTAGQLEKTLRALEQASMLTADGMLVFEQSSRESPVECAGWRLVRDRTYGDTRVLMYNGKPEIATN